MNSIAVSEEWLMRLKVNLEHVGEQMMDGHSDELKDALNQINEKIPQKTSGMSWGEIGDRFQVSYPEGTRYDKWQYLGGKRVKYTGLLVPGSPKIDEVIVEYGTIDPSEHLEPFVLTKFDHEVHGDHANCEICWAKISDLYPTTLFSGYKSERNWVCEKCVAGRENEFFPRLGNVV